MTTDRAVTVEVFLPKQMRARLLDVNVCRGEGWEMSDDFLVETMKVVGGLRNTGRWNV